MAPSRVPRREAAPQPQRPLATSANPGQPPTCGVGCSCPQAGRPGRAGGRCTARGPGPLPPAGSPWLLFLCVKIPPPAPASLPASPASVLPHSSSSLAPQILPPASPRTPHSTLSSTSNPTFYSQPQLCTLNFSSQLHLCTPASLLPHPQASTKLGGALLPPVHQQDVPPGKAPGELPRSSFLATEGRTRKGSLPPGSPKLTPPPPCPYSLSPSDSIAVRPAF